MGVRWGVCKGVGMRRVELGIFPRSNLQEGVYGRELLGAIGLNPAQLGSCVAAKIYVLGTS